MANEELECKGPSPCVCVHEPNSVGNDTEFFCSFPGCGKVFTRMSNKIRHQKIHCDDKKFVCNYESCRKSFLRKSDLFSHILCHTKQKRLSCSVCLTKFARLSDLMVHERRHMHEKPFRCDVCGRQFPRLYELQQHAKKHAEFSNMPPYLNDSSIQGIMLNFKPGVFFIVYLKYKYYKFISISI